MNTWNDDYAFPVRQIVNANHYSLRYEGFKTQLEQHYQEVTVQNYFNSPIVLRPLNTG